MTLDKVLHQSQDRGSTWTYYFTQNASDPEIHTEDKKKKKKLKTETLFLSFQYLNISLFFLTL